MHRPPADATAAPSLRLRCTLTAVLVAALITGTASAASAEDTRNTAATVTNVSGGLTVAVTGQGYNVGLPNASTGGPASGVYASLVNRTTTLAEISGPGVSYADTFLPNGALAFGLNTSLSATVEELPADAELDVVLWSAHGFATESTLVARVEVDLTDTQRAELFSAVPTIAGNAEVGETLTATVGGKWGEVFDLTYQWYADGVAIADATALTLDVTAAQAGKAITFSATATPDEGDAFTIISAATPDVPRPTAASVTSTTNGLTVSVTGQHYNVNLPNASTNAPASGVYAALIPSTVDSTAVTASSGSLAAAFVPKALLNAGLATSLSAPAASLDASADYDVIVWVAHGNPTADTVLARVGVELTAAQRAEMVATTPTISGTVQVGRTLTASTGTWDAFADFEYQWYADGVAVDGATNATFVVASAQLGDVITVKVTSLGDNPIERTSAASTAVTRKTSVVVASTASGLSLVVSGQGYTGLPNSSLGAPAAGVYAALIAAGTDLSTITAGAGHVGVAYISGANIIDGDVIASVSATAANLNAATDYEILMWTAHGFPTATTVVNRIPVSLTAAQRSAMVATTPSISGVAQVGSTLTAATATWGDKAALTYQWKADGTNIADATGSTYELTDAEIGKVITVAVSGTPAGGSATSRTSAATVAVLDLLSVGSATITGTVQVGETLTAHVGDWEAGTDLSYQWLSNGAAIAGATAATYVVPSSQYAKTLSVKVTGKRAGAASVVTTSAATATVKAGTFAKAATPTVSGSANIGSTLTAKAGTWDSGVTLTYRWYANGKPISGATKSTFKPTSTQYGKTITLKVTGTKAGYTTVVKTSKATASVKRTLSKTPTPKVSGTARVGSTLVASPGTWDSGVTRSYQWYANGKAIKGATSYRYKIASAYKVKTLTVKVTGKKSGYASVAKTSKATATVK